MLVNPQSVTGFRRHHLSTCLELCFSIIYAAAFKQKYIIIILLFVNKNIYKATTFLLIIILNYVRNVLNVADIVLIFVGLVFT